MDGALPERGSEEMVRAPPTKGQAVREPSMRDAVVVGRGEDKEEKEKERNGRRSW
jgi:hypothetical protein